MMCCHGGNSIFSNEKKKDWTSRSLANPPPSYVQQHLVFVSKTKTSRFTCGKKKFGKTSKSLKIS